jgi:sterol desaturase/sphingolipid hydroxylase (fatty acid hydroxylase superfamily)
VFEWIANQFAALQALLFENAVLPALHTMGFARYAELAFGATEFFLIGAIEIPLLALVLGNMERWWPVETQNPAEKRVDIIYTALQRLGVVPLALFFLMTPLFDAFDAWLRLRDIIPWKLEDAIPALNDSPWLSLGLYLVILDFFAYWLHRWQHRLNFWWSLHSLHHSQRSMGFWADDRTHLLDNILLDTAFTLVALVIGVPPGQFVTIVVATRVLQSLSHANLRWHFGRVGEYLLVSPRFHRVHHGIGVGHEGALQGCNFAVLLPIWDVLYRTANFEREYPQTGIRDQLEGRNYGAGFWEQQWLGLKRLGSSIFGKA